MSDIREAIGTAITEAFGANDEMVTKWALVAEVIDSEGQRGCWMLSPDDQKAWDSLGLLEYARQVEQAGTVMEAMEDEA